MVAFVSHSIPMKSIMNVNTSRGLPKERTERADQLEDDNAQRPKGPLELALHYISTESTGTEQSPGVGQIVIIARAYLSRCAQ